MITYDSELSERFRLFPDDWAELRSRGLAFFRYSTTAAHLESRRPGAPASVDELIAEGFLRFDPIVYEDFLPVSAAGIFQSNPVPMSGGSTARDQIETSSKRLLVQTLTKNWSHTRGRKGSRLSKRWSYLDVRRLSSRKEEALDARCFT